MDGITTKVTNATPPIHNKIARTWITRAMLMSSTVE